MKCFAHRRIQVANFFPATFSIFSAWKWRYENRGLDRPALIRELERLIEMTIETHHALIPEIIHKGQSRAPHPEPAQVERSEETLGMFDFNEDKEKDAPAFLRILYGFFLVPVGVVGLGMVLPHNAQEPFYVLSAFGAILVAIPETFHRHPVKNPADFPGGLGEPIFLARPGSFHEISRFSPGI